MPAIGLGRAVLSAGLFGLIGCTSSVPTSWKPDDHPRPPLLLLPNAEHQEEVFDSTNQPEVEFPDCEAKLSSCCLCVKKDHEEVMKVTLSGTSAAQMELLLNLDAGPAPEFGKPGGGAGGGRKKAQGKTGGSPAPLKCSDPGTTYVFDLYGGTKDGDFTVHIQEKDKPDTRKLLGYLCVADPSRGRFVPEDLGGPKPDPADMPAGATFSAGGCVPAPKAKPDEQYETITQPNGDQEVVYIGKVSKTPPYATEDAPRLLKTWEFVCTEIQMWCVSGSFRFIKKDLCDPTGGYVKMGECIWAFGKNMVFIKSRKCRGGRQIIRFRLWNVDMEEGKKGQFTFWEYDFCTGQRSSFRVTGLDTTEPWNEGFEDWKVEHGALDKRPDLDGGVSQTTQPQPGHQNNIDTND